MISAMRHMCRSRDNLHSFRCVDGKSQTQVVSRGAGPSVTHRVLFCLYLWWSLIAVTLSVSSLVAFVNDMNRNTLLIKMPVSLCKPNKLHPKSRLGCAPLIPVLGRQIQTDL